MLFSRYGGGADLILNMEFEEAIEIVKYASEQRAEDVVLKRWITNYEQSMSYEEFKNKLLGNTKKEKATQKEIITIMQELQKTFGGGEQH